MEKNGETRRLAPKIKNSDFESLTPEQIVKKMIASEYSVTRHTHISRNEPSGNSEHVTFKESEYDLSRRSPQGVLHIEKDE